VSGALVQYEEMRVAVAACARVDEAAAIRDKAEKLAAYARMRDDDEMEMWVAEIKLRATQRIGELSRDLDRAHKVGRGDGQLQLPSGGKLKAQALADAGISTSTAHRAEELAGGADKNGQAAAIVATNGYFAKTKSAKELPTMKGLRAAVRDAVRKAVPEKPRSKPPKLDPNYNAWLRWVSAIKDVAELDEATFAQMLVVAERVKATAANLKEARTAHRRLQRWIGTLEGGDQ
jgi:hypothetical protein